MNSLLQLAHYFSTHPLTKAAPMKAWGRFGWWQLRCRLQDEVVVPWMAGQKLVMRRGMRGATGNLYVGLMEFVDMMLPLHFLRSGDHFLDVGANVGSYTVLASGVCGARTWAFEPDPQTSIHLRRNISINRLEPLTTVFDCALGDTSKSVPFTVGLDTINSVADARHKNTRIVRQEPLDALIGTSQPIMVKIDVEGYEEQVLLGARDLLSRRCLKLIEIETVTPTSLDLIVNAGFERAYYEPFTRALRRRSDGFMTSNSYFVRDWSFVQERLATGKPVEILGSTI